MKLENLNALFVQQLRDLYSAENQLIDALPKLADGAKDASLKKAFENHLKETRQHAERIEKIMEELGEKVTGETCKAMKGLVAEGAEMLKTDAEEDVMDAGLIADAQRVEHYEIAAYGTVCAFAKELGLDSAKTLLEKTLEEEKNANEKLNEIALKKVNARAAQYA